MTTLNFEAAAVEVLPDGDDYIVRLPDGTYPVKLFDAAAGRLELLIDGRRVPAYVSSDGPRRWVTVHGRTCLLTKTSIARASGGQEAAPELLAPMPGQVRVVSVSAGDLASKGQVLLVLEAMKMEIRIQAPFDGRVIAVEARVGQTVERDQVLIRMQKP